MNLYLMRHGIAADRADSGAGSGDRERPLTPKGIKRMHKAAKGLVALSLSFDRILTSPLERARQTAKIVAQTLQLENQLAEIDQLCPDQSVKDLISGLVAYSGAKKILLVGHEPLLSSMVSYLLSGRRGRQFSLRRADYVASKWTACRRKRARCSTGR